MRIFNGMEGYINSLAFLKTQSQDSSKRSFASHTSLVTPIQDYDGDEAFARALAASLEDVHPSTASASQGVSVGPSASQSE